MANHKIKKIMSLIIEYTFITYKQKNKIYEFIISLFNFFSNKIFSLVSQLTFNYKSKYIT